MKKYGRPIPSIVPPRNEWLTTATELKRAIDHQDWELSEDLANEFIEFHPNQEFKELSEDIMEAIEEGD